MAQGRDHLYELLGHADLTFGDAVTALRAVGHDQDTDLVAAEVVGRNVLPAHHLGHGHRRRPHRLAAPS